ncbi:hypothetical protein K474DRAFT_1585216 [Panus rudis PR-1116 ss-1]|nr:hypothetical protein K474DRAFT_1585216 [Panus rudis PR-1116 ss-1]
MSNPHSLSTSLSQRIATQLPFSPTSGGQRRNQNQPPGKPSSIPPHVRTGSVVSSFSRNSTKDVTSSVESPPGVPPLPTTAHPRPIVGAMHAGVLSSSSLVQSRPHNATTPPPSNLPPVSSPSPRPGSPGSMLSMEAHAMTPVHVTQFHRLDPLASDASDSVNPSTEDLNHAALQNITSKTTTAKHSREPLLPIGPRSPTKSSFPTHPSISVNPGPYGRSDGNSPTARMRDSFEKLFKRRQSSETQRKPTAAGPSHGMKELAASTSQSPYLARSTQNSPVSASGHHGRMTFEVSDDDGGRLSTASRYKGSISPAQDSSISLQHLSFNPIPPTDMNPPLAETPIISEKTGKPVRKYELYPSRNRFFLRGRILTGGDSPWAFIASLTIVLGITGVYFGTTCVWWWLNESPAVAAVGAYMCLLSISSMCATAFRDPGILPRNLDPEPPYPAPTGSTDSVRAPLPRDLKVRAGTVRVKYCPTCRTYRPPRSSHCKMCDNCVDNCDHHCQWVNNCIGRRNYTTFFTFLFSGVLTLVLVICTTAIHLWLLTTPRYGITFNQALQTSQGIGSAVAFSLAILVIWPLSALLAYHARLLLLNVTTIEQIRNQAHKTLDGAGPPPPNPFSHGNWRKNLFYVLCRPQGFSWLDARGIATEDKREINPGLLDDHWQGAVEEGRGPNKRQ